MPRSKEEFERIKKERMNSILSAGLYLFALYGYDAVSSEQITKRAGCSHGLLYHYFNTKEEFFNTLMINVVSQKYREIMKNVDKSKPNTEYLRDFIEAYLNGIKSPNVEYACAIHLVLNLHLQTKIAPKLKDENLQRRKAIFQTVYNIVEEGKKTGKSYNDNPLETSVALFSCLRGLSFTRIHAPDHFVCPDVAILMRMLVKNEE